MPARKADALKEKAAKATAKKATAAESFIEVSEEEAKQKKRPVSFFVGPALYDDAQQLAQFRAAQGQRNEQGQPYSVGALLNDALKEYLDRNKDELEAWKNFSAQMEKTTRK